MDKKFLRKLEVKNERPMIARTFEIRGEMKLRLGARQGFRIYVRAVKESEAMEKVYSVLGSRHKVTRNHIKIHSVKEVSVDEIEDNYIKSLASSDKVVVYTR
ncbi:50S ribosomal protein L18Ae [Infirmifilum sp. NZ]|uniref:50S ribosomal protein L18Ae n=1 Tax=Infirmifilum sp. NZ TaxID=2926850 RepID=UPI000CC5AC39|nr:50S ribosomal protein L18Ae [Infirmifilum sp. NZ]PLJ77148.1 MAG: hypothetical protein B7L53_08080 [Thermofilum sp. NZ13]UNQ72487.1 50S ribosomal protein L18Ae [Infirmifilum sp. NZ]